MIRLLAIDPGLRYCGMAIFEDGDLVRGWLARTEDKVNRGPHGWTGMADGVERDLIEMGVLGDIHALAIEVPQIYQTKYQKGDQDDIIQLACAAGAVATRIRATHKLAYLPREWKGQVPKSVHNLRVVCRLSKEERERIDEVASHLRNNVIDAIGIGIFTLAHQGTRTWGGTQRWRKHREDNPTSRPIGPPKVREEGDGDEET